MNVSYVLAELIVGLIFLIVTLLVIGTWLCLRLKRLHNALWISLGSPMPGRRQWNMGNFQRFLRTGKYKSLDDVVTRRLAAGYWIVLRLFLAYIFVGVAIEFVAIKFAG
jgi:hypothetical protein